MDGIALPRFSERPPPPSSPAGVRCCGGNVLVHRGTIKERLRGEGRLFFNPTILIQVLAYLFIIFYLASFFFRNLAFYRHRGLVYYADQVAPQHVASSLDAATVIDLRTGAERPLLPLLSNATAYARGYNVSLPPVAAEANLSALNGQPFELLDLGHELILDLSDSPTAKNANEVVAVASQLFTYGVCFVPIVASFPGKDRPHAAAMFLRLVRAMATAHSLRMATYMVTSLPGPADHCQSVRWTSADGTHGSEEVGRSHVQTVSEWFFSTWNNRHNSNCGDLLFSGHTVTALTNVMLTQFYAWRIFPRVFAVVILSGAWLLFVLQVFFALATHNHYSADIVIALYIAPLNFLAHSHYFPNDPTPDSVEAAWLCGRPPPPVADDCDARILTFSLV